jgi:heme/copper-type cytochrome/quinol oxidase subunit 4
VADSFTTHSQQPRPEKKSDAWSHGELIYYYGTARKITHTSQVICLAKIQILLRLSFFVLWGKRKETRNEMMAHINILVEEERVHMYAHE